jgi:two-component system sensor histidine kinase TctE
LTRASKAEGFSTVALDPGKDELNVVSFVYNDAAEELRLRKARIDDLDAGLRRFVQSTEQEIAGPLGQLESKLAGEPGVASALLDAHALTARVANLTAAARLKMSGLAGTDSIDLGALLQRVVDRHQAIAKAAGVTMETTIDRAPVTIAGDTTLVERAVSNLVDNAILYNRPGGRVVAGLSVAHDAIPGSFRLWIEDTGRGVTEDEFKTLTAIRRFRGDEGRIRRPGAPGLGLAVAREVADRFHMRLELKRPGRGGFEAELSPRPASLPQAEADQALDSPPA